MLLRSTATLLVRCGFECAMFRLCPAPRACFAMARGQLILERRPQRLARPCPTSGVSLPTGRPLPSNLGVG